MSRFMAGAVFALALVAISKLAVGEDEEPRQSVTSSIVTRSLTIIDENGRKRAVLESRPSPNDYVQLQLLDTAGEAQLTLI